MAIITNYLLFNHTYLRRLQADSHLDEQASLAAQGVRDWHGFRDDSSVQSMVDSWVGPLLNTLELELQPLKPGDARGHLLYTAWDHTSPVGLCYVAPPGADLNTTTKGRHWMAEAVLAARNWKPAPGADEEREAGSQEEQSVRWVILTNGDQWRLLDAQALRRYEAYLQVDLEELVYEPSDLSALRVFYRCFHRSAFERDSEGESGLDRLLEASSRATKKAEDHLKACVSANEGVMAQLCLGLVESTGKDRFTDEERDAIYRDATYLLYRMLFVLYAEARELLPMDNPAYRRASLAQLVEMAHEYKLKGIPDPNATTLWDQLKQLCNAIYESDEALGIPAYNGGLFDDADKPYLRDGTIADGHLTQALFDLAYQPDGDEDDGYRRIDYRDLSVRHLGSIYEGMIEYRLQIAEETLWARRDKKGNVRFLKTGQDGAPRRNDVGIEPGDVYFSQSPGERKATGTYYTPEFIVDYIVRQTVVRGLEERRASLEERLRGWVDEVDAAIDASEERRMERTADEELLRFVEEEVLTFRVCDPAMGSGHFLVNAAHHLTAFVVETLHLTPWAGHQIDVDPNAWRRTVVERCLYGVDINLIAVELAKLSLWLASVAEGKPLSFLDHHLRHGNSLIGVRAGNLVEILGQTTPIIPSKRESKALEAGQLSMLEHPAFRQHVSTATALLDRISARAAETLKDIGAKKADLEQVRLELDPFLRLSDLLTAQGFGLEVDGSLLTAIAQYVLADATESQPSYEHWLDQARDVATSHCFFHWELEFPLALLGRRARSSVDATQIGFDMVIGNPPYRRELDYGHLIEEIASTDFGRQYRSPRMDLWYYFMHRGLELLKPLGTLSFITNAYWIAGTGARKLISVLREYYHIDEIFSLGDLTVFEDVSGRHMITRISNTEDAKPTVVKLVESSQDTNAEPFVRGEAPVAVFEKNRNQLFRSGKIDIQPPPGDLLVKLQDWTPLSELGEVRQGIAENPASISGRTNERYGNQWRVGQGVFALDPQEVEDLNLPEREKQLLRPYFHLCDLGRYYIAPAPSLWLIYSTRRTCPDIDAYPTLRAHLNEFRAVMEARRETRNGSNSWWHLHWPREERLWESPKLLSLQMGERPAFVPATLSVYVPFSVNVFVPFATTDESLYYVSALLNSRLIWVWYQHSAKRRGVGLEINGNVLARTPIRTIDFADPSEVALHDRIAELVASMLALNRQLRELDEGVDLFHYISPDTYCERLDAAFGGPLSTSEMIGDLSTAHHDIEGLRLNQEDNGRWRLEVRAKLRDPEADWREHQQDEDGNYIRRWLPVACLTLDEATGRFYHYAFANLDGFDGAGRFPGGFSRTTLKKLQLTKVPKFVPVDLEPMAALLEELADVRRRIQLTDDLIDQIVYRLYGLSEEEIAIVEGRS